MVSLAYPCPTQLWETHKQMTSPSTCYTVTSASSDVTFHRTPAAHLERTVPRTKHCAQLLFLSGWPIAISIHPIKEWTWILRVKVTNYRHFQFTSKVTLVTLEEMLDINNNTRLSRLRVSFVFRVVAVLWHMAASLTAPVILIRLLWSSGGDRSKYVSFTRDFCQLSG